MKFLEGSFLFKKSECYLFVFEGKLLVDFLSGHQVILHLHLFREQLLLFFIHLWEGNLEFGMFVQGPLQILFWFVELRCHTRHLVTESVFGFLQLQRELFKSIQENIILGLIYYKVSWM